MIDLGAEIGDKPRKVITYLRASPKRDKIRLNRQRVLDSRLCMIAVQTLRICHEENRFTFFRIMLERFRTKASPGLDPGWIPVREENASK
jgi:hypothetical protein